MEQCILFDGWEYYFFPRDVSSVAYDACRMKLLIIYILDIIIVWILSAKIRVVIYIQYDIIYTF